MTPMICNGNDGQRVQREIEGITVCGWDVGGVNTKVARVVNGAVVAVRTRPYEIQRDPGALAGLLREMCADVGGMNARTPRADRVAMAGRDAQTGALTAAPAIHAITMTAELSQFFRTKREGVAWVLDAFAAAFPDAVRRAYTTNGEFVDDARAREEPLAVAASNWVATASLVAQHVNDVLLIDIGSTTTDIIPMVAGKVVARGRTDLDRLRENELLYLGAVRTPVEAIVHAVPVPSAGTGHRGDRATPVHVAAENFALIGDVHVWRGVLAPEKYTCPTPDGRPVTREFVRERLARVVCADREMLADDAIDAIANHVAERQIERTANAIAGVCRRHPEIATAIVTGIGDFVGDAAARQAGLSVRYLREIWADRDGDTLGELAAQCAPAAAVARLFSRACQVRAVVKVGGALLRDSRSIEDAVQALVGMTGPDRILVVPGGGARADEVRRRHAHGALNDDEAHWLAIQAMDHNADLLLDRLRGGARVESAIDIVAALADGRIPVLAPYRWLRTADALPHSWDVTSDSIAAWIAGEMNSPEVILLKRGVERRTADVTPYVDPYFARALPPGVRAYVAGRHT